VNVSYGKLNHPMPSGANSFILSLSSPATVIQLKDSKWITFATTKYFDFQESNIKKVARQQRRSPFRKILEMKNKPYFFEKFLKSSLHHE